VIYAIDLNDKETPVSVPMVIENFRGAQLMITNGYFEGK
jgi:CRISPR/Cas system-associated protein Csx1